MTQIDPDRKNAFRIAALLITGAMLLIGLGLVPGAGASAKDLAGIFSGWITAIVGFYFIHGQSQQTAEAAKDAGIAQAGSGIDVLEVAVDKYKKQYEELNNYVKELLAALQARQQGAGGGN